MTQSLTTTTSVRSEPPANSGAGLLPSAVAVALRTVRKFVRTPQLIVYTSVQSVLFLLVFRYIFGGALDVGGQSYVDFLVPGFVATAVLFSGMGAAVGVAEDGAQGFADRLRSLPIPRVAVLAARALADTVTATWSVLIAALLGFAVGFRLHGSFAEGLAAFGLCVLFGFVFTWVFITIGLVSSNAQAAQGMSMLVFPLVFVSNAYVPVDSLPGWLRAFGDWQPVTPMVNAVRSLVGGDQAAALLAHGTSYYVGISLIWSAAIVAVFGFLAVSRFSRR